MITARTGPSPGRQPIIGKATPFHLKGILKLKKTPGTLKYLFLFKFNRYGIPARTRINQAEKYGRKPS